ncbi:hypothetical protein BBO99_00004554 [Phytophthora kernoviae]|uniref:GAF domain-containing protein n=1 Tax=Phytophthora kernoviae TaxID=325452 RepID=A0A3R7JZT6_9STRA|nr:hypothetical protein BBI17_004741 [Phytophthora kernoviae]RLN80341.1 hypothetical protein BBO99_00004554 [Phytophthora kernoviae]
MVGDRSSRLHRIRFRSKTRSATASSLVSSVPYSSTTFPPKPRVHVDDTELCARAEAVSSAMDFRGLAASNEINFRWMLKNSRGSFTTYSRRADTSGMETPMLGGTGNRTRTTQQVLAAGEIRCSLQEVARVLHTTNDYDHNAVMSGLYRKDFIYGSVVHVVPSPFGDELQLADLLKQEEDSAATQVAVKTGTFVHSKMFSPNEQWCFLERSRYVQAERSDASDPVDSSVPPKVDSFTLTLSSLDENELGAGKVNNRGRVNTLHGMSAGYLVEQVVGSRYVRVIFFGQFDGGDLGQPGRARPAQMRARLTRLANGACHLPEVIRRRRFGAQTMADRQAFPAKNSRCICCTKSLHLLTQMETQTSRRIAPVRVCSRCLEFVDNGDYSAVEPGSLGHVEVKRDPINQPLASKTLARLLRKELRASSGARKDSVRSVIQYLVNQEEEVKLAKAEAQARVEDQARADAESGSFRLTSDSTEQDYLDVLDKGLPVPQVPLYQCVLANASKRSYPIKMPKTAEDGCVPDAPIPNNEKERLAAISRSRIMEFEDASELDMLCSLAASQLDCKFSIVTVVTGEHMTVLASNQANLRRVQLPREHSFCQHTIMTSKPLLVPHPEADVRFQNITGRVAFGVRFYCGFPIVAEDRRTVIGSFCCMDQKTHDLSQTQYSAMKKLAAAASQVVRSKTQELEGQPPIGSQ